MKHLFLSSIVALPLLSGCATDPYSGRADIGSRAMGGALVGAAAGALLGPAVGSNSITGAAAGMVAGGALGAATTARVTHRRQYYRDTRGYCYYIDQSGQPRYNYNVSC